MNNPMIQNPLVTRLRWNSGLIALAIVGCVLVFASPASSVRAAQVSPMRQFLERHCNDCHSGESAKAGIRLDSIGTDFSKPTVDLQWQRVFDKIESSQMPPADAEQPTDQQRAAMIDTLASQLRNANLKKRAGQGRAAVRRLTRIEYENTVQDLLGIDLPLVDFLPEDATSGGFDKVASALRLSPIHLEQYLAAAGAALDAAIVHEPKFDPVKDRVIVAQNLGSPWQRLSLVYDDGVVLFGGSPDPAIRWKAPAKGAYRFRFLLNTHQSTKPLTGAIRAGDFTRRTGINHLIGYYDIEPGGKREIDVEASINAGESIRFLSFGIDGKPKFIKDGVTNFPGPGIWLGPITIEGPLEEEYPPKSHRRLFGDLPLKQVMGKFNPTRSTRRLQRTPYYEVVSTAPQEDADSLLKSMSLKAFRRPADEATLRPFLSLVHKQLDRGKSFEQALRSGYIALLCSSDFLFVSQPRNAAQADLAVSPPLDAFDLASRLSYFLWSSMPDDELMRLAKNGTLVQKDVLHRQVERMLADPKSDRFVHDFVGQWLDLKLIDFTAPDRLLYPDFDDLLKVSMVEESRRFFREILDRDLSVSNFVHSDFVIINERLADHYGIEGVQGQAFRRVKLPPDSHRGGVLTHASVLKVTADGTKTSPVLRGVWLLERILGQPVPPPPPGVPAAEPDIRGTTSIREVVAKHRAAETCAVCHRHIDPLGFALESYDVIGGFREQYRASRQGKVVRTEIYRRPISYRLDAKVEPADQLHDGRRFANMDELKQLLADDPNLIARSLFEKLITYSTGCSVEFADRSEVENLLEQAKSSDYGLRSMIHSIVQSHLFRNK